jgi:hypothetical protein
MVLTCTCTHSHARASSLLTARNQIFESKSGWLERDYTGIAVTQLKQVKPRSRSPQKGEISPFPKKHVRKLSGSEGRKTRAHGACAGKSVSPPRGSLQSIRGRKVQKGGRRSSTNTTDARNGPRPTSTPEEIALVTPKNPKPPDAPRVGSTGRRPKSGSRSVPGAVQGLLPRFACARKRSNRWGLWLRQEALPARRQRGRRLLLHVRRLLARSVATHACSRRFCGYRGGGLEERDGWKSAEGQQWEPRG